MEKPFIFHDENGIIVLVGSQIIKIRHYFGDKPIHAALYLRVYATVIVQVWQIIRYHNNIVGGASPNHFLDIGEKSNKYLVKLFKLCADRNKGVVAAEFKVSVI